MFALNCIFCEIFQVQTFAVRLRGRMAAAAIPAPANAHAADTAATARNASIMASACARAINVSFSP